MSSEWTSKVFSEISSFFGEIVPLGTAHASFFEGGGCKADGGRAANPCDKEFFHFLAKLYRSVPLFLCNNTLARERRKNGRRNFNKPNGGKTA